MRKHTPSINISHKVEHSFPNNRIIWGSQDGGQDFFPEIGDAWGRKNSVNPTPLKEFGDTVRGAQERVWIIDEYLLMPDSDRSTPKERIAQILEWMPLQIAASDIRFLTKQHEGIDTGDLKRFWLHAQAINNHAARRARQCFIEVRIHLKQKCNFMHDRFAIIDNELWHFGATVGGFHSRVSAATRGWNAKEHDAIRFFEELWSLGENR